MDLRDQIQSTLGDAFTVERELGGGGMSRVFVALESSLARRIVIKVLPPDTVAQVSVDRFKREIKVAASLQHPHIVPLLSAGDADGLPYFTMPFVKGESLRERLVKGGELSVKDAIHVLRDVAAALAYAHGEGVVHRDIKPENIMLSGGVAVVTDFGVAKAVDVAQSIDGSKRELTSLGVALGTPAYMSPEQASADPHVDHRADIYSFGCVAYEMLAGASPFAGRPMQQILAAHVMEAPEPLLKRRPQVPPALAALIMKCLEKRAGDRPQSADELLTALDAIATPSGGTAPTGARLAAVGPRLARKRVFGAIAIGFIALVIAMAPWLTRAGVKPVRTGRVTSVATSAALEINPAISPDGKFVAYASGEPGSFRIFVRQITGERAVMVSGELGGRAHTEPRWSPDGARIAFVANGSAYVVPATGGSPKTLIESGDQIASVAWSPDGASLAYSDRKGLWVRSAAGGEPRRLADGPNCHSISWSPDGAKVAYLDGIPPGLNNQSVATGRVVNVSSGARQAFTGSEYIILSPVWLPDGRALLYISNRDGTPDVYQQAIGGDGRAIGAPERITTGLRARTISLSADGRRLTYDVVRNRSNIWTVDVPASGAVTMASARQITGEAQRIEVVNVSHDGKWLAFDSDRNGNFDIYKVRVDGGEPVQLTSNPSNEFAPSWELDDKHLLFHASRGGKREIYSISADGGAERQLTHAAFETFAPHLSPDGKRLLLLARERQGTYSAMLTRDASGAWSQVRRLTPIGFNSAWPQWSPDGRWISELGDPARFRGGVLRIIDVESGMARVLFERPDEPAQFAIWPSAKELYFNTTDDQGRFTFYSIPLAGGAPRTLLRDDPAHRIGRYDFATDGRRLFFTLAADESDVYVMEIAR
jgi:Tol biopolymer transport system component